MSTLLATEAARVDHYSTSAGVYSVVSSSSLLYVTRQTDKGHRVLATAALSNAQAGIVVDVSGLSAAMRLTSLVDLVDVLTSAHPQLSQRHQTVADSVVQAVQDVMNQEGVRP